MYTLLNFFLCMMNIMSFSIFEICVYTCKQPFIYFMGFHNEKVLYSCNDSFTMCNCFHASKYHIK